MFAGTDTDHAPWIMIRSNDKRARLNAMRYFLSQFSNDGKNEDALVGEVDPSMLATEPPVSYDVRSGVSVV